MSQTPIGTILPQISVESVDAERAFYLEKLGFEHVMGVVGKDGEFEFCVMTLGGASIMLTRPQEPIEGSEAAYPTKRPLDLYVCVADVDRYHVELQDRGVKITEPLVTQWWGDRNFAVTDPYGYQIWFFQEVAQPNPPSGVKLV